VTSIGSHVGADPGTEAELSCPAVTPWAACDRGNVELASPVAALFAEDAFESLSWDTSVLGEAHAALANSKAIDCEKFCHCWPWVEICALGPIGSWARD
jgi:hypothetical protein